MSANGSFCYPPAPNTALPVQLLIILRLVSAIDQIGLRQDTPAEMGADSNLFFGHVRH